MRAELKDRGSKFIAYLLPVKSQESFKRQLDFIKSQEPNARHYCWALILGSDGSFEKYNDDGEPRNTAGAPILRALKSANITNVACVVARYFGGTKLGVPGLIAAYGGSAREACSTADIVKEFICEQLVIACPYSEMAYVERMIKLFEITDFVREQEKEITYIIRTRVSLLPKLISYAQENHNLRIIRTSDAT